MKNIQQILVKNNNSSNKFTEMLLENRLDKEVERIAFSFNLPLNLLLFSKYRLKYNRIYPNGIKYDIYAFFCTLFLGVLCFYRIFTLDMTNASMSYMERAILTVVPILFFTIYFIGFVIVFVSDIVYKDNNVLLILTIQTINRSISFSKTVHSFNMWTHISFATVILVNLITRGTFYLTCRYSHISEEISDIVRDFSFVTTDVNMVIATRIIILLKQYIDLWIKAILTTNVAQETDLYCQKLFGVYMNIIKAYKIYRKVFQALVSFDFYIFHLII
ncbi:uncharacterized protein LOC110374958 [Helicoverpa armigera]|uniref:uncharacterized protein LOC110374958 n=1 Tax=Helicoverpa armigera TaxID=29058 RepID=UPI003083E150